MYYTIKAIHNMTGEEKLLEETYKEKSSKAIEKICARLSNSTWSYYCQEMNSLSIGEATSEGFKTEVELPLTTNLWNQFKLNPQPIVKELGGNVKVNSTEPAWDGIEYVKQ